MTNKPTSILNSNLANSSEFRKMSSSLQEQVRVLEEGRDSLREQVRVLEEGRDSLREQVRVLEEGRDSLREQVHVLEEGLSLAKKEADDAKKTARFSRCLSVIAVLISISMLVIEFMRIAL